MCFLLNCLLLFEVTDHNSNNKVEEKERADENLNDVKEGNPLMVLFYRLFVNFSSIDALPHQFCPTFFGRIAKIDI